MFQSLLLDIPPISSLKIHLFTMAFKSDEFWIFWLPCMSYIYVCRILFAVHFLKIFFHM